MRLKHSEGDEIETVEKSAFPAFGSCTTSSLTRSETCAEEAAWDFYIWETWLNLHTTTERNKAGRMSSDHGFVRSRENL